MIYDVGPNLTEIVCAIVNLIAVIYVGYRVDVNFKRIKKLEGNGSDSKLR